MAMVQLDVASLTAVTTASGNGGILLWADFAIKK
jgi:hypothetical protein